LSQNSILVVLHPHDRINQYDSVERFTIGLVGVMPFNCSKTGFISLNSKDISAQLQPKTFYTFVNRFNVHQSMKLKRIHNAIRFIPQYKRFRAILREKSTENIGLQKNRCCITERKNRKQQE
jgi:hypothetical protein